MPTDTDRLNWLAEQHGAALINDDNGHWTVCWTGMQNVPEGEAPCDIQTTFFVEAKDWHEDIRAAIDAAAGERDAITE